ncbi:hypothetical protein D3C84_919990 [compost metagenome]
MLKFCRPGEIYHAENSQYRTVISKAFAVYKGQWDLEVTVKATDDSTVVLQQQYSYSLVPYAKPGDFLIMHDSKYKIKEKSFKLDPLSQAYSIGLTLEQA